MKNTNPSQIWTSSLEIFFSNQVMNIEIQLPLKHFSEEKYDLLVQISLLG